MSETMFKVDGMTCKHCKMNVEKAIQAVSGVESVTVDLETKEVVVTGQADHKQIIMAIKTAGYSVVE
ncbi:MAG TPA: heavy metal-associated domain-containing protein [Desulfosporosinus sp.]|nr:heavy metal-associated domain-containing protein [Desulfosporosinus sp.]